MSWKLYVVVSSAGAFVATYLMSPTSEVVSRPSAPTAAQSARDRAAVTEIEALADSLRRQMNREATFHTPGRDPFHFQSQVQQPPAFVPPPAALPPPPPLPPPLPMLNLSGIASDVVDGKSMRSAVVSLPAGVVIVREGESLAGLYKVVAIGEESIDLESTTDGSRRTLRLGR
jgi:hypothetical protein